MVTEKDGLGTLQVGVARGNKGLALLRLIGNGGDEGSQLLHQLFAFFPEVQPQIQCHLIVAASGGMELLAHISQPLGQHLLHEHMDVLTGHVEGQLSAVQIRQNFLQTLLKLPCLLRGDDILHPQHGSVGDGAFDILPVHPAVEADGGIEIVCQRVGFAGGHPGPEFCHDPYLDSCSCDITSLAEFAAFAANKV